MVLISNPGTKKLEIFLPTRKLSITWESPQDIKNIQRGIKNLSKIIEYKEATQVVMISMLKN